LPRAFTVVAWPRETHVWLMRRISIECLSCKHRSSIPEDQLTTFGLSPDAPIAKFIRRLICTKCGSRSVRVYRYDVQNAG